MLTVLLATRNGAATLDGVLEAYRGLQAPSGGWHVVVVDNGSTDSSRQIIAGYQGRLPLTYVFEPQAGKNTALNTGLRFVAGDIVVLTDDDVFPRPDWLVRLRDAADANPTFGIFGGPVLPRWEATPPAWLFDGVPLGWTYTVSDSSLKQGPIGGRHIFGPNMAVRAALFGTGVRFDPTVGPDGSRSYAMGSETEFVLRVMASGVNAWYVPEAAVDHFVRATQMRRSWIVRRMMRAGRCDCRLYLRYPALGVWSSVFRSAPNMTRRCFGVPIALIYQLARRTASLALASASFSRANIFRSMWMLGYVVGFAREARTASMETRAGRA